MLAGAVLLDLDDYENARRDLDQALRLNSKLPSLFPLVGMARNQTGHQKGADLASGEAINQNPDDFNPTLLFRVI
jgi:tetratricopeptide (TPR) repeat protein